MYILTVTVVPENGGFVVSDGDTFESGTVVSLFAQSFDEYVFDRWIIDDTRTSTKNPISITMNKDRSITVYFFLDTEAPVISEFSGPAVITEPVFVFSLEGTDNRGISHWLVQEPAVQPDINSAGWIITKPTHHVFHSAGIFHLYTWARDAAGNISEPAHLTVEVVDNEPPVILEFSGPALTNQAELSLVFAGEDNFGISGWIVDHLYQEPLVDDLRWKIEKPSIYTLPDPGIYTLYAWLMDTAGNISESDNFTVIYDNEAPQISISGPSETSTAGIPIDLQGTDNREITHWILNDSSDIPLTDDQFWTGTKPENYTLPLHGENTVYAWAKDEAGNISSPAILTVNKTYQGAWTIMVWLDGDNDLETFGIWDINEMEYGLFLASERDPDIEDNLAIIVQIDRIPGYDNTSYDNGQDWTDTRRYLIKPHASSLESGYFTSQLLEEVGEVNMGDGNELRSYIEYCKTEFPANKTMLILWNHGVGTRRPRYFDDNSGFSKSICVDMTNDGDILYIGEISDTLTENERVNVLGFDACYMGMAEIAYEFRPRTGYFCADYMVASPSTVHVYGWDYDRIVTRFMGADVYDFEGDECITIEEMTAVDLAGILVKEYQDSCTDREDQTIIAYDLGQGETVKIAFDILSSHLVEKKTAVETMRGSYHNPDLLHYFDVNNEQKWIQIPHFDLYAFAENISGDVDYDLLTKGAAAELMVTVDNCIVDSWAGSEYNGFQKGISGMGFFFPAGDRYNAEADCSHYELQYWYSGLDLSDTGDNCYGKLDFCITEINELVQNWKELLEYWYDENNEKTPDSW